MGESERESKRAHRVVAHAVGGRVAAPLLRTGCGRFCQDDDFSQPFELSTSGSLEKDHRLNKNISSQYLWKDGQLEDPTLAASLLRSSPRNGSFKMTMILSKFCSSQPLYKTGTTFTANALQNCPTKDPNTRERASATLRKRACKRAGFLERKGLLGSGPR